MTKRSILQVEDDENDAFLLKALLQENGVTNAVHLVTDGQMAVDYLTGTGPFADREKYPLPCMMLMDLKLPKKSGLEVLAWLRQQPALRRIVVIMFTSSALPEDISRAYELGANCFLVKPVEFEKTVELIKLWKNFWLDVNQYPEIQS